MAVNLKPDEPITVGPDHDPKIVSTFGRRGCIGHDAWNLSLGQVQEIHRGASAVTAANDLKRLDELGELRRGSVLRRYGECPLDDRSFFWCKFSLGRE